MDPWLKALNVLACAAVLAASGWWGWSQWQAGRPGAAMVEPAAVEAVLADLAAWSINSDRPLSRGSSAVAASWKCALMSGPLTEPAHLPQTIHGGQLT
jgi:predicted negative regulator of RcsB-dependent stress response